ncbi:MAG TPA: PH domain-containing protein [Thermoanaerobaculia bacterium]|nr:PH domain-containing protein [Thermoanaerobaculia bacterium]
MTRAMLRRFPCTPGGSILRGRRRLRTLLVGLAVLMLAVALAAGVARRIGPALVALAVALVPWTAWRMSGDLDPFWLETGDGWLGVQMRRRRERFNVAGMAGAQGRRLTAGEIAHLETLVTSGGVAAGTGGFESHRLGEFDLYASDLAHAVLVDLGETRLILTPDDPEGFLEALSSP